jgi:tRNA G26 N,N-dimethylase Trm1
MDSLVPSLGYDFDARFLQLIKDEARLDLVGFHDIHGLCKKLKVEVPNFNSIFAELEKRKLPYTRTHFLDHGVKCSISEDELMKIIKKVVPKR